MRSRGLGPDLSLMFDDQSSDRGGSTVELEQADTSASFTGDVHATAFADVEVCTEVVADAEPVAHIDHLEAKQIADQLWATWIERTSRGCIGLPLRAGARGPSTRSVPDSLSARRRCGAWCGPGR